MPKNITNFIPIADQTQYKRPSYIGFSEVHRIECSFLWFVSIIIYMINSEDIGGNRIMCVDIAARSVIHAYYVITQTEFECQSLSFLLCKLHQTVHSLQR